MEWSQKRRILYATLFVCVLILLAAYPTYQIVHKNPTCFDQKQNGTETGVDCGGGCALMCASDMVAPRVVWAKTFSLDNGNVYDIGAYIENVNASAGLKNAHYELRVLDSSGNLLLEKKGSTEIAPASRVLLFETGVTILGVPDTVTVTFDQNDLSSWYKATSAPSPVVTKNQNLINTDTKPRFDAVLVNTDPVNEVTNLTIGAVIYDSARNPIAVSKTYIDSIPKGGEQDIFFTWPNRFINPSNSYITEIVVTPRAIFTE